MKLNKIVLSTGLAVIIGSSSLFAADTTVITKATVKLIKNQRLIKEDIKTLKERLAEDKRSVNKTNELGKTVQKKADTNKKAIDKLRRRVDLDEKQMSKNTSKIGNLKREMKAVQNKTVSNEEKIRILEKALDSKILKTRQMISELKSSNASDIKSVSTNCVSNNCSKYSVSKSVEDNIDSFIK